MNRPPRSATAALPARPTSPNGRVATATNPDRADGGDPARFADAAAAYTLLRTRFGRGEALADRVTPRADRRPATGGRLSPRGLLAPRGGLALPGRLRRGRPAVLALRVAVAVAAGTAVAVIAGTRPATPALITGLLTWLLLTARHDLAPPR